MIDRVREALLIETVLCVVPKYRDIDIITLHSLRLDD